MDMQKLEVPDLVQDAVAFVTCTVEGILEEEDLRELAMRSELEQAQPMPEVLPQLDDPTDLARIKERHHHVARLIASGLQQSLVASICNYTESYLSVLLNNPSMQELVQLYRIQSGASVQVITEQLKTVGLKALERLSDKMEAGELNNNELIQTAKLGLDRGGHGPQSKAHVVNEHHLLDHTELAKLNAQARERNKSYIVPSNEVRAALEDKTKGA